jgi:hypothetical protein
VRGKDDADAGEQHREGRTRADRNEGYSCNAKHVEKPHTQEDRIAICKNFLDKN